MAATRTAQQPMGSRQSCPGCGASEADQPLRDRGWGLRSVQRRSDVARTGEPMGVG